MVTKGWLFLLVGWFCACTPAPQTPLVMGTVQWIGSEPLFLARELHLFPSNSIHLVEYTSSEQLRRAFRNGAIDVGVESLEEVLNLERRGQSPRVVMVLDSSHGADCLVARPELRSLAALRGKRVATEQILLSAHLLHRALEQTGMQAADVEQVIIPLDSLVEAWRQGEVDAVVTFEPYCRQLVKEGAHILFDSSRIPGEIVDVLVVRERFLREHPEQVDALVRGWFAALEQLRIFPFESAALMAPRLGLDAQQFLDASSGVRYVSAREQRALLAGAEPRLRESLRQVAARLQKEHLASEPQPIEHLIDASSILRITP